jgi:hypothetical protein
MTGSGFWDGADIISVYTREQAIDDGVLIDVTETAREAGFVFPVAMTCGAWGDLVAWDSENPWPQDESGRLWDVLTMMRFASKRQTAATDRVTCEVLRVPNRKDARKAVLAKFYAVCGPGDEGEPVVTVMLLHED